MANAERSKFHPFFKRNPPRFKAWKFTFSTFKNNNRIKTAN